MEGIINTPIMEGMPVEDVVGATFPVPKSFLERILDGKKDVFVKPATLTKLKKGMKIVFYASREDQGFHGEAEVESVEVFDNPLKILERYGDRLFLTEKEFKEYVASQKRWGRERHKPWMAIVLRNIRRYPRVVKPKRFVAVSGRYVRGQEYEWILKNAGVL
ncbi:DUF365 domain-containing protein [Thermococcus litoralis]|nr:DUF365 domain-containing protein [Thermococcus litoralis]